MGLKSEKILGISVTTNSREEILEYLKKYLNSDRKTHPSSRISHHDALVIVTPNPEQVVLAQEDTHFAQLLNEADVALPDGIGLVGAMRFLDQLSAISYQLSALKRIPGVEFMEELVALAAKRGYPIGLIGGRVGVAVEALECLQRKYPSLIGGGQELGEIQIESTNLQIYKSTNENRMMQQAGEVITSQYFSEFARRIQDSGTRIVFVGLGAPKQEYFIARLARECQMSNVKCQMVLMSVGGSFDLIAGRTRRAPFFVRSMGLEWLWRLAIQPWRFRRQLRLLQFLWLVCIHGRD